MLQIGIDATDAADGAGASSGVSALHYLDATPVGGPLASVHRCTRCAWVGPSPGGCCCARIRRCCTHNCVNTHQRERGSGELSRRWRLGPVLQGQRQRCYTNCGVDGLHSESKRLGFILVAAPVRSFFSDGAKFAFGHSTLIGFPRLECRRIPVSTHDPRAQYSRKDV